MFARFNIKMFHSRTPISHYQILWLFFLAYLFTVHHKVSAEEHPQYNTKNTDENFGPENISPEYNDDDNYSSSTKEDYLEHVNGSSPKKDSSAGYLKYARANNFLKAVPVAGRSEPPKNVRVPAVSCPHVFQYRYAPEFGGYFGVVSVQRAVADRTFELEINMTIDRPVNEMDNIKLVLLSSVEDIRKSDVIYLAVIFPYQDLLPTVTLILYNGMPICTDDPGVAMPGTYRSHIWSRTKIVLNENHNNINNEMRIISSNMYKKSEYSDVMNNNFYLQSPGYGLPPLIAPADILNNYIKQATKQNIITSDVNLDDLIDDLFEYDPYDDHDYAYGYDIEYSDYSDTSNYDDDYNRGISYGDDYKDDDEMWSVQPLERYEDDGDDYHLILNSKGKQPKLVHSKYQSNDNKWTVWATKYENDRNMVYDDDEDDDLYDNYED